MPDIRETRMTLAEELVAKARSLSDAQEIDRESLDGVSR